MTYCRILGDKYKNVLSDFREFPEDYASFLSSRDTKDVLISQTSLEVKMDELKNYLLGRFLFDEERDLKILDWERIEKDLVMDKAFDEKPFVINLAYLKILSEKKFAEFTSKYEQLVKRNINDFLHMAVRGDLEIVYILRDVFNLKLIAPEKLAKIQDTLETAKRWTKGVYREKFPENNAEAIIDADDIFEYLYATAYLKFSFPETYAEIKPEGSLKEAVLDWYQGLDLELIELAMLKIIFPDEFLEYFHNDISLEEDRKILESKDTSLEDLAALKIIALKPREIKEKFG